MKRSSKYWPLGDGSEIVAAKMLDLPVDEFRKALPRLLSRGFPAADPTTGKYDLDAVNEWRKIRHPRLFDPVQSTGSRYDANEIAKARIGGG
jgi:hypothetical protein